MCSSDLGDVTQAAYLGPWLWKLTVEKAGSFDIDKVAVRRSFDRAAPSYDGAAVLQREVCERMLGRLEYVRLAPEIVLDAGSGTGYGARRLRPRYPRARIVELDLAPGMLAASRQQQPWWRRLLPAARGGASRYACGDIEALPFRTGSFGLVWSNLALQWSVQPQQAFAELLRVLAPGGLLMFSTFGPDTLKELRSVYAEVDDRPHVSRFPDMHDLGDMLVEARFADPVMDMECITLTYPEVTALMRELKAIGAHNAAQGRACGLTGKSRLRAVEAGYERLRRDGRLPATFEVVYGHAWKPLPRTGPGGRPVIDIKVAGTR